jgi:hypothetical protein
MNLNNFFESRTYIKEHIGTLAQLNLGPMINLLRQSETRIEPGKKFSYYNIGSESKIADGGNLKGGIKGLRSAYRALEAEGNSPIAFAVYIGNTAVAFGIFDESNLAHVMRKGLMSWDLSSFKEPLEVFPTSKSLKQAKKSWEKELTTYYGRVVKTEELKRFLERVDQIAKANNLPLTFKIVLADKSRQQKRIARQNNPVIPIEKSNFYDLQRDLKRRLQAYKLSKNPEVNTAQELIELIKKVDNATKKIRFGGFTYNLKGHEGEIKIADLLRGDLFYSTYRPEDIDWYSKKLEIGWQFDLKTRTIDPVVVKYSRKGDNKFRPYVVVLDNEKYLSSLTDWNYRNKKEVIPYLLEMLKNKYNYFDLLELIKSLKQVNPNWTELDTIEAVVRKELSNEK